MQVLKLKPLHLKLNIDTLLFLKFIIQEMNNALSVLSQASSHAFLFLPSHPTLFLSSFCRSHCYRWSIILILWVLLTSVSGCMCLQSQNIVRADQGQLQWIYRLAMISTIYSVIQFWHLILENNVITVHLMRPFPRWIMHLAPSPTWWRLCHAPRLWW